MPGKTIGNIDFSADSLQSVKLWQYDDAKRLNAILDASIDFSKINIADFWRRWYSNVFNVDTADDFGLALWGRILGVQRITYIDPADNTEKLVSSDMYRKMLKARAFCFACHGALPEINHCLQIIFPGKPVFCRDNYNMSVTIIAYFEMTAEERAVLLLSGFLPIPCGVESHILIIDHAFGFKGSELENFKGGEIPPYTGGTFIKFS